MLADSGFVQVKAELPFELLLFYAVKKTARRPVFWCGDAGRSGSLTVSQVFGRRLFDFGRQSLQVRLYSVVRGRKRHHVTQAFVIGQERPLPHRVRLDLPAKVCFSNQYLRCGFLS